MKPKQSKTSWETFSGQAFSYSFVSAVTAHRAKQISLLAYFFFFFFFLSSIAAIFSLSFFHLHPVGAGLKKSEKDSPTHCQPAKVHYVEEVQTVKTERIEEYCASQFKDNCTKLSYLEKLLTCLCTLH